jgi:MSHA pilin protein MshA
MNKIQPFNSSFEGFTLIELVLVIVILGILAVVAAPKYLTLSGEAKAATLKGIQASLNTGVKLIQSKAMVMGKYNNLGLNEEGTSLTFDGLTFTVYNQGVPREIWYDGFEQLISGNFNYLGSGTGQTATVCSGADFCVIDNLLANTVIADKGGYGIFFTANGHKLTDKDCFAFYLFEIDSDGLLINKETGVVSPQC